MRFSWAVNYCQNCVPNTCLISKSVSTFYSMSFNNDNHNSVLWEELDKNNCLIQGLKEESDEPCHSWASLKPQMVKNLHAVQETWVLSLGQEDPLQKGMATHSSILAWKIPWREEPGRLHSLGSQSVWLNHVTKNTAAVRQPNDQIPFSFSEEERNALWVFPQNHGDHYYPIIY